MPASGDSGVVVVRDASTQGAFGRRTFLQGATTAGIAMTGYATSARAGARPAAPLREFTLDEIALDPASDLAARVRRNATYLLSLDNDRMLVSFRTYARLPLQDALPYGGWEAPSFGSRGHFVGHYLSALAKASRTMRPLDTAAAARCAEQAHALVRGLAECQAANTRLTGVDAPGHSGYLNAQSPAQFDRLEALQPCDVPYYVIHKIMAGLLDAHVLLGDDQALGIASGMADYFAWRMNRLPPDRIAAMTETRRYLGPSKTYFMEFGGMLEVTLALHRITANPAHLQLAQHFDRPWFREMLRADADLLGRNGEHANTDIPNVLGMAQLYDVSADPACRTGALNFLGWMADGHEFANGAVSGKSAYPAPLDYGAELFNSPRLLDRQVNGTPGKVDHHSGESCCSHNLNRLTRHAIRWTRQAHWGDRFENRFVNAVLAQQNPESGMLVYNLDLKQGAQKNFGTAEGTFWCCYGTGVEAYASITEGAYFHDGSAGLWVSNFMPATLHWRQQGLRLRQRTAYPDDGLVTFEFGLETPRWFTFNLRIPAWAAGATIGVNGSPYTGTVTAGSFAALSRNWVDGDRVELRLPFRLRVEPMIDRPDYAAVKYGPNLLVPCTTTDLVFNGSAAQLVAQLKTNGEPCGFDLRTVGGVVPLRPIRQVKEEHYAGYVRLAGTASTTWRDSLALGDDASARTHDLIANGATTGIDAGHHWLETASLDGLSCRLAVDPERQTYLRCRYNGDDGPAEHAVRLFDIEIAGAQGLHAYPLATQSLDREAPGQLRDILYPIPAAMTAGRRTLSFRFLPKGLEGKTGRAGRFFDHIETLAYDI